MRYAPRVLPELVQQKLDSLPAQPGVYLFKDKKGVVVYVGKAKSLKSRVRSYFQASSSDERTFIPMLPRVIGDLETVVTGSEKEAAILEDGLVKRHQPRFNIKLRDDKSFILLKLTTGHAWPRLEVERMHRGKNAPEEETAQRKKDDKGAKFFGPYHSATAARRTLHLVNKHFQLRTCGDLEIVSRRRPCLQHQIKRCPAPCVLDVDPAWYADQVRAVAMFLDGRHDELSKELDQKMKDSARAMRFELAAVYRDQLRAIEVAREEQRVVSSDGEDRDVLGLYREGELVELALLTVRGGKLADVPTFSLKGAEIPDDEIVSAFLTQHYAKDARALVPHEILVPALPEGVLGVAEWLSEMRGTKVTIAQPQRGTKVDLLSLANENARHSFVEKQRTSDDVEERLAQLQERLRLPTLPRRIECCDISHLGGGDTVGAIVALRDGTPDKKRYRSFHVKGVARMEVPAEQLGSGESDGEERHVGFNDDYGAMYEVLARRFRRGLKAQGQAELAEPRDETPEKEAEWELPDLFVVDGGRGQLAVALAASRDLGLHSLPIVALAKEKENALGDTLVDRVYLPGQKNPIPLKSHSASLFFLARARDEAHRFSNFARKRLGKTRRFQSALDEVPGIGPVIKKSLLTKLGSVAAITKATDDELLAVPGVRKKHVDALRRVLPKPQPG